MKRWYERRDHVAVAKINTNVFERLIPHSRIRRDGVLRVAWVQLKVFYQLGSHTHILDKLKDLALAWSQMERIPGLISFGTWSNCVGDLPSAVDQHTLEKLYTPLATCHKLEPQDLPELFIVQTMAVQSPRSRRGREDS